AQFETKQFFFQFVETVADFALDFGDCLSGRSAAIFWDARRVAVPVAAFRGRGRNRFRGRASPKTNDSKQEQRGESRDQNILQVAAQARGERGSGGGFAICI